MHNLRTAGLSINLEIREVLLFKHRSLEVKPILFKQLTQAHVFLSITLLLKEAKVKVRVVLTDFNTKEHCWGTCFPPRQLFPAFTSLPLQQCSICTGERVLPPDVFTIVGSYGTEGGQANRKCN